MKNLSFFQSAYWFYLNLALFGVLVSYVIYMCIVTNAITVGTYVQGF